MNPPKDIHDATRVIHNLCRLIIDDIEAYFDGAIAPTPQDEYFEGFKNAALDIHLLATWIKDHTIV